jgi:hypothetical protein
MKKPSAHSGAVLPGTNRQIVGLPSSVVPRTHNGGTENPSGDSSPRLHERMHEARLVGRHEEMTQSRKGR